MLTLVQNTIFFRDHCRNIDVAVLSKKIHREINRDIRS
jgi:hypothetical protein